MPVPRAERRNRRIACVSAESCFPARNKSRDDLNVASTKSAARRWFFWQTCQVFFSVSSSAQASTIAHAYLELNIDVIQIPDRQLPLTDWLKYHTRHTFLMIKLFTNFIYLAIQVFDCFHMHADRQTDETYVEHGFDPKFDKPTNYV
ncbi:hypothetical protein AVEN_207506-1 [Araneus ventricosus]|uniref:Uncharacterized protein n=1 Tax=Araneus ventricosus TaxID=182803 RepID=A0A4Y2V9B9_ARAVE|nr:hypothetical protein AVEN_207506-1 [Araneus ventricosus]